MNNLFKKAIAEAIGTVVLVFVACGTAVLTGGNVVATSLAFGLVIVAMAYSIGRVSGCHINPAVSLGCLVTKRMTVKEFLVYVAAQVVGGFLGAVLLFGVLKMSGFNFNVIGDACNNFVGGYKVSGDVNVGGMFGAIIVEVVLTMIFVGVILNVTDNKATDGEEFNEMTGKFAGILIGLTLTLVHLIGCGLTGTSVNPARSLATALTQAMYFQNTDALAQVWVFIAAPLAGGALAAVLFNLLHGHEAKSKTTEEK